MRMMKDYHDLSFKCDVLLLGECFEQFRNSGAKNNGLSTSHYLIARSLIWDAMLSLKKVEYELISDADMYLFFVLLILQ